VNLILKKYYPEIKEIDDKLHIKSILKFYFDLIDKLTDFIRNVEYFNKLDENYYNSMIKFLLEKEELISGIYREISTRELTTFYDKATRDNLEKILEMKLQNKSREFFTFGSLEEEIKKIAKVNGANQIQLLRYRDILKDSDLISDPRTIINYIVYSDDEEKLKNIGIEIKSYLVSKGFEAMILILEASDIIEEREGLIGSIITNAKLFSDDLINQ
jgi:hypothetical protein